ncbi:MAG: ATP-binding cassette domain-containing protein [Chitinophagaceae bacterium]
MLQLTAIRKSFGSHHVFSIDELLLPNGLFWLKGANGSGKSTLMKLIAGLLPFEGEIILNEKISIHKRPADYRFLVNHSAAEPIYPSFLTGNELLEFVGAIKKGTAQQIEEVKEILGIDSYLANPTGSYSSGMLKKLSLLLAFTGKPVWILLDEPFTTLDQASQSALCELLRQRHKEGISFIITSHHDIETSDIYFNKVFTLKDKQLSETISGQ